MNTERKIALLAAAYVAGIVLCFGPATLQSERASAAQRAQCMAEREGDQEGRKWCRRAIVWRVTKKMLRPLAHF